MSVGIGAAASAGALLAGANSFGCPRDQAFDCNTLNAPVVMLGTVALLAFVVAGAFELRGQADAASPGTPAPPAPPALQTTPIPSAPPLATAVAAQVPQAAQLTQQAYLAARLGQCVAVRVLGERVRALDLGYYERVFAVDATIASCR